MDITQPIDAKATVLLGKDMTLRDYAQACWRMRGLGRGQSVRVILVQELVSLVYTTIRTSGDIRTDVVLWLLSNSVRSEHLQQMQLCHQDIAYTWRRFALQQLRATSKNDAKYKLVGEGENTEQINVSLPKPCFHEMEACKTGEVAIKGEEADDDANRMRNNFCLSLLTEHVDHSLPQSAPKHVYMSDILNARLDELATHLPVSSHVRSIVRELSQLEKEAEGTWQDGGDYDAEVVQEQEQQQQKEQQQSSVDDVVYSSEKSPPTPWAIVPLLSGQRGWASPAMGQEMMPLRSLHIWNMNHPRDTSHLLFPPNIYVTRNHTSPTHRSNLQRRLKDVYVAMSLWQDGHLRTILLSLAEAEAVRVHIMRERRRARGSAEEANSIAYGDVFLYMVSFEPGQSLLLPYSFDKETALAFDTHLQCLRFFNCDLKLTVDNVALLKKALARSPPAARHRYFTTLLVCRDKGRGGWGATTISGVFDAVTEKEQEELESTRKAIVAAVSKGYRSLKQYFFQKARDGALRVGDLLQVLRDSAVDVTEDDVRNLFLCRCPSFVERGEVDLREFIIALTSTPDVCTLTASAPEAGETGGDEMHRR